MNSLVVTVLFCTLAFDVEAKNRIVGGEATTIEKFPYQISLEYRGEPVCGGSILDKKTVLTAAHCTDGKKDHEFSIRAGSTTTKKGGAVVRVSRVHQHEGYNRQSLDNDISIMKLDEELSWKETVKPVNLPRARTTYEVGTEVIVSGWGLTNSTGSEMEEILRKVELKTIGHGKCSDAYTRVNRQITPAMLCAEGDGHMDACQGDSGGPLVENGVLVGVVSWGVDCGHPDYPGVYTNVVKYIPWIDERLEEFDDVENIILSDSKKDDDGNGASSIQPMMITIAIFTIISQLLHSFC